MPARLGVLVVLLGACASGPTVGEARALYAQQAACPDDRIAQMVPRPDLRAVDVMLAEADQEFVAEQLTPPADVAADPVRAKMWKDQKIASLRAIWDDSTVFEFNACNKHGMLLCQSERASRHRNGPTASCVRSTSISRPSDPR